MKNLTLVSCAVFLGLSSAALAQSSSITLKPKLIVAISIDQFSADLFDRHRAHFSGGLKRMASGIAFANGYQSHAATETCPGHSTILSGLRPARTGIVANDWFGKRKDKDGKEFFGKIYCVESEDKGQYDRRVISTDHYSGEFSTLGDRVVTKWPQSSRSFAVSGKDRAALGMGGKKTTGVYWYEPQDGKLFHSLNEGASLPDSVTDANLAIKSLIADPNQPAAKPPALSDYCKSFKKPMTVGVATPFGNDVRPQWPAGNAAAFRISELLDQQTLKIATGLISSNNLGGQTDPDVLAISLSGTDYIGHALGTNGPEMCSQLESVDAALDQFFKFLDERGMPYAAVLTADHGGVDFPERDVYSALSGPQPIGEHRDSRFARRAGPFFAANGEGISPFSSWIEQKCGLPAKSVLSIGAGGDYWINTDVNQRQSGAKCAKRLGSSLDDVAAIITSQDLSATPMPKGDPSRWTLAQRARASLVPDRSGAFFVFFKERTSPIIFAGNGYVATHGSPWDYDRRVPILFWWPNIQAKDRTESIETVDILPSLASLIDLPIEGPRLDGRCIILAGNCKSADVR